MKSIVAWVVLAIAIIPRLAEPQHQSTAGMFLVATPDLVDPNFHQTVVLMLEHDEYGALGLVINRRLAIVPIEDLFGSSDEQVIGSGMQLALHAGGPVDMTTGFILHSPDLALDETQIVAPGIAVTSDPAMLQQLAQTNNESSAFAAFGYAGWAPNQLDAEIERGSWIVTQADREIVFDLPIDERWSRAFQSFGIDL